MSNLLTHAEYMAIAKSLSLPQNAFINNGYRPAISGKTFPTINPATGETLTQVAACNAEDVDFAVAKAREAFNDGRWSKLPPAERKGILIRLTRLLSDNIHELAVLESLDSGKTILDCETVDLPDTIACIKWHAEAIDKLYDQVSPASDEHIALIVRQPVGVVGLVLPWNFPLLMLAWKTGPALAAGCSVVVKPAEETSLSALYVAELAHEAGLPAGVLNIVTGTGVDAGEPIGRHPDIDMVSFTGSTDTGRRFLKYSAESNLKEVVLEMGGKNPCIVMDDAEDLDVVASHVVNGAFWNMGENCSASSRLIVHQEIKDLLLDKIKAHLREWTVGDPLNPDTRIGPLVSKEHFNKVSAYLQQVAPDNIVVGGQSSNGTHVEPTIVESSGINDPLCREEIFGPVLSVITIGSFDEAISVANNTPYGLSAALFTANGKRALRGARALNAGTVTINSFGEGDVSTPFGGFKQSGFGGRDKSVHAHDQYTQLKTIWIDLSDKGTETVS